MPDALLQRFEDVRLLGEGGMGAVYRAHDPRLGRDVAVKLLRRRDASQGERLLREARAQARVEHPNACRVYEVGEAGGELYIVMQYVDGPPLSHLHGKLTVAQKATMIHKVACAVAEAHRLGLIHCDIKPGNILVETRDGGSLEPVVVDFGLAREIDERRTAGAAGTPAYMAPEQASGAGTLDERTDVYGLGAALYDLLAWHPPYQGDDPRRILSKLSRREPPPPLRAHKPGVPRDLEAIVMKCLEHDASLRYGSARALAEDLERFLAGEAVLAKAPTRADRLRRWARRHRLWVSAGAAAAIVAATLGGFLLQSKRDAARDVELAQELGREAAAMELLMRSAYQLPLHDVERERAVVRERMTGIERRMAALGPPGEGPGHYALGRGAFALGRLEEAREHLERARAAGYRSPELDWTLARTLLETYQQKRQEAEDIRDEARKRALLQEIDRQYRSPAREILGAALPADLEAPQYGKALLAFSEERYDEAAALAREAYDASPLLYEAELLEGRAHMMFTLAGLKESQPDWWQAFTSRVEAADRAYRAAEDAGRSDPRVHDGACTLWTRAFFSASYKGKPTRPWFERARDACARGVQADGASSAMRTARARMLATYAFALANNPEPGQDPGPVLQEAVTAGEEALRLDSGRREVHEALFTALRARIIADTDQGRDARASIERAITVDAGIQSAFPDRQRTTALVLIHIFRATQERWRGTDLTDTLEPAFSLTDELLPIVKNPAMVYHMKSALRMERAIQLTEKGESPEREVELALADVKLGKALIPDWVGFFQVEAAVHGALAEHALAAGKDPRDSIAKVREAAEKIAAQGGDDPTARDALGAAALLEARLALRDQRDPGPFLDQARAIFQRCVTATPWVQAYHLQLAQVELVAAEAASVRGRATAAAFNAVGEALKAWLAVERSDPEGYEIAAEAMALEAEWRAGRGAPAEELLGRGLAMAMRALSINPRRRGALRARERLRTVQLKSSF